MYNFATGSGVSIGIISGAIVLNNSWRVIYWVDALMILSVPLSQLKIRITDLYKSSPVTTAFSHHCTFQGSSGNILQAPKSPHPKYVSFEVRWPNLLTSTESIAGNEIFSALALCFSKLTPDENPPHGFGLLCLRHKPGDLLLPPPRSLQTILNFTSPGSLFTPSNIFSHIRVFPSSFLPGLGCLPCSNSSVPRKSNIKSTARNLNRALSPSPSVFISGNSVK